MTIGGISIILILGIVNFLLLLFQLSTGLHWIKVKFGVHRKDRHPAVHPGHDSRSARPAGLRIGEGRWKRKRKQKKQSRHFVLNPHAGAGTHEA